MCVTVYVCVRGVYACVGGDEDCVSLAVCVCVVMWNEALVAGLCVIVFGTLNNVLGRIKAKPLGAFNIFASLANAVAYIAAYAAILVSTYTHIRAQMHTHKCTSTHTQGQTYTHPHTQTHTPTHPHTLYKYTSPHVSYRLLQAWRRGGHFLKKSERDFLRSPRVDTYGPVSPSEAPLLAKREPPTPPISKWKPQG